MNKHPLNKTKQPRDSTRKRKPIRKGVNRPKWYLAGNVSPKCLAAMGLTTDNAPRSFPSIQGMA